MKHYTILNPYWWGSFVIFLIILICSMTMLIDHKVLFSCGLTFGDSNVYTWESSKGNLESLLSKLLNFFSHLSNNDISFGTNVVHQIKQTEPYIEKHVTPPSWLVISFFSLVWIKFPNLIGFIFLLVKELHFWDIII